MLNVTITFTESYLDCDFVACWTDDLGSNFKGDFFRLDGAGTGCGVTKKQLQVQEETRLALHNNAVKVELETARSGVNLSLLRP